MFFMNKHKTESYSADYFSTCMHLAAISLKNESYSGLVYLPIRCVIISVFWGWNKADHTPPSLSQQLLAWSVPGMWWFMLGVTRGWSRALCPKQNLISVPPAYLPACRLKKSSRRGQWMSTFRETRVDPWSLLCRWMLSYTFFHLPLIIMVMHH